MQILDRALQRVSKQSHVIGCCIIKIQATDGMPLSVYFFQDQRIFSGSDGGPCGELISVQYIPVLIELQRLKQIFVHDNVFRQNSIRDVVIATIHQIRQPVQMLCTAKLIRIAG